SNRQSQATSSLLTCETCGADPCINPSFCRACREEAAKPAKGNGGDDGEHKTQSDLLVEIAAKARLFHTADQEAFADITVDGHREPHGICGAAFRRWLRHEFYKLTKRGCNADALKVAVETMDAMALFEGESREVHIRVAKYGDDIYIDIGDAKWSA